jgi:hypothetical protein
LLSSVIPQKEILILKKLKTQSMWSLGVCAVLLCFAANADETNSERDDSTITLSVRYQQKNSDEKFEQETSTRFQAKLGSETLVSALDYGTDRRLGNQELWVTPTVQNDTYRIQFCVADYVEGQRVCRTKPTVTLIAGRAAELTEFNKGRQIKIQLTVE